MSKNTQDLMYDFAEFLKESSHKIHDLSKIEQDILLTPRSGQVTSNNWNGEWFCRHSFTRSQDIDGELEGKITVYHQDQLFWQYRYHGLMMPFDEQKRNDITAFHLDCLSKDFAFRGPSSFNSSEFGYMLIAHEIDNANRQKPELLPIDRIIYVNKFCGTETIFDKEGVVQYLQFAGGMIKGTVPAPPPLFKLKN